MDETRFWAIIEDSLNKSAGSFEAQEAALQSALAALPIDELEIFARMFIEYEHKAYRWDLWAAAYLIGGGCSDDSFWDFRTWLISRGQTVYNRALENPDSLADVDDPGEDYFFEGFQYIAVKVFEERSGKELPNHPLLPKEPHNPDWYFDFDDKEEMSRRLPRLSRKRTDNPKAFG